jgi:formylglycine-generating enzyme required for sulfatase activity
MHAPLERQVVAIEHRWMHAETLCYLLHRLPLASKRSPSARSGANGTSTSPEPDTVEIPKGSTTLGQRAGDFGWDNEFPRNVVDVPALTIDRHKVTNADYLRFVADGGPAPPFWRERDGRWWLLRMFDEVPLPADEPVYATHRQASDYAQWAGAALPTEAQWHRAAYGDSDHAYPWGDDLPSPSHGNFDFVDWDTRPVSAHPRSASRYGAEQLVGNGWEWTSTPFAGFDGFTPSSYYPGYSANFFDGEHWVLKGGSPRTARALLRRSFRNWFRGDYPFAYTTFRLAWS